MNRNYSVNQAEILSNVKTALAEDIGSGDLSAALIPDTSSVSAEIVSREAMLLCGSEWVEATFKTLDPAIELQWLAKEGAWLAEPRVLCRIQGLARSILTAERTALNFLQTLSATATQTHKMLETLRGTDIRLLDTRKTLPGLRKAQKYAVVCGGGYNHRLGLYDAFLIKENHIKACGSITAAVAKAKAYHESVMIEVEVETLEEFREALSCACDRVMLDNFSLEMIREAVAINQPKRVEIEVSGNIDIENIKALSIHGIDFISVGALTKSIRAIDLSLRVLD